jgi:hypothetical protein
MIPRRKKARRAPDQRHVLVIEPCGEARRTLIQHLRSEGYQVSGTDSMEVACSVVKAPQICLVLVNLSAFPATAICALGQALAGRSKVRLLALVTQMFPEDRADEVPVGRVGEGEARGGVRELTTLLRLSGPEQLSLGWRPCRPN